MNTKSSYIITVLFSLVGGAALVLALQHTGALSSHTAKASAKQVEQAAKVMYNCPMHPQIIRDHPGTCPLCGMDLVPMKDHNHQEGEKHPDNAVRIDATMVQSIGVQQAIVQSSPMKRSIRLTGTIAIDPQRIAVVNARTTGWIESVLVGSQGLRVKAGQTLATFYSPDLVAAQEDYLQALQARDERLIFSARKRLEVLGLHTSLIDSIRTLGSPQRMVPLLSPLSGIVLSTSILKGQNAMEGTDLYSIADLSRVWVVAKAYPQDLADLQVGIEAQVLLPGQKTTNHGQIIFISPVVDPQAKTAEVRVEIKNSASLDFKPGMIADLQMEIDLGQGIAIASQSVIRTGERSVAIVALGNGYFAPREISLGASLGDSVEVLAGLQAGDTIVTSAQFLIDSESNLKKAVQAFGKQGGSHAGENH